MEPLNKKERTSFIFKFTAFFILGILVVLIPFYFIFRMPSYENSLLTKDLKEMQGLMKKQKDVYAVAIDSITATFARYDLANDLNRGQLSLLLDKQIFSLQEPFRNDTSWSGRMYNNIANSFLDLKKTKNDKIQSDNALQLSQQDLIKTKEDAKAKAEQPVSTETKGKNKKRK
jgi:hypothetical protein